MSDRSAINIDGKFSLRAPKLGRGERRRTLPFKRSIVGSLFIGGFLAAFSMPYFFFGDMMGGPEGSLFSVVTLLFTLFFMIGWSVGVGFIALLFLGSLFGREVLILAPGFLSLRMELFGMGLTRTFNRDEIQNLHRHEPEKNSPTAWRGPHLQFTSGDERIDFGCGIDLRTAELLQQDIDEVVMSQPAPQRPEPVRPLESGEAVWMKESQEEPLSLTSGSSVALILANVVPIIGVLFFGWSVGDVMLLYWSESAVIGIYNIAKMWVIGRWLTLFLGPFFFGHFGGFMVGHLLFIYGFIIKGGKASGGIPLSEVFSEFVALAPAVIALFISHGVSFVVNFLGRKEYEGRVITKQMGEPYRRIFVMHITLLFGGFLTMQFANPLPALVLMIVLKVGVDLRAHLSEHTSTVVSGFGIRTK